ncbi:MAG: hypothetical protein ACLULK_06165 [Anaerovoracaceae bacterium]
MMRKLQNVEEFFCHWASSQGRGLNAVKLFLNSTPAGKLRILEKDLAFINKYFGDRLKEPIKFTDEQIAMIQRTKDMTEDEVRSVINTLNTQIWEQIPATLFERLNEFRRFSMLANPKTHIRNLAGNSVFALGRTVSDYIEVKMMKSGAVKKAVAKRNPDAKIRMVDVSNVERKEAKDFIYNEFDKRYENMDSAVKWRDDVSGSSESVRLSKTRPDSVQTSRFKHLDKGEKFNYKALDKEDLIFMKPAYNNAYIRFCKSEGIAAKDIKNINKEFADRAHSYAFAEAERVCFRDTTYLSKKITSAKDWTLRNGKTKAGTVGRRALNVALESTVPFIKTPINIFSRSVDYSPLGMSRGLFELATSSKNAYRFMDGIHHISTGLTGTGVFVFGAWAYNAGFVTLEAGNKSGDAYYDRDMGFQDYSINVLGYSYTIDWLSPMQTSFFMGGAAMQAFQNKGNLFEDLVNGLASITNPMLDMSFMSTPKDMADTFLETTYNGDGVGAAVIRVVLGDVPQGYLSGFTPQIFSQTAGVFDKYKRDTSSTSDNPLVADWQSFFKQQANKIPGIRNVTLNKKLDSRGNPINTGDNVFMRIANAYVNPSNVSKIRFDKYDKELIKTYNEMSDGEGKEKFWYNFTGNPSYDLANGKRMTYDEKYSYARTSRQKQFGYIKDMIDSKRYGGMSADMKATEIKDYSFLSQSQADKKVYGVKYAIERIGETGSDGDKKAIKLLDESYKNGVFGNKTKKQSYDEFFNFYTSKEKILAKSHDSSYGTKAFALANFSNGNKEVENRYAAIFDIHLKNVDKAKEYIKKGGTEEEFTNSMCSIQSVIKKADANSRTGNKAVALSKGSLKIPQRFAECINLTGKQQNMGYGLDKVYNYSFARLDEMYMMAKFDYDKDRNGYLNQKEVKAYIDSLGLKDNTEKALLFVYFKGDSKNNPYGSIPNYLGLDNYNGGGGGNSRKSYGSRRGRSGKSSASSSKKTSMQSWEEYLKDYLSNLSDVDGVNFKNWDSPLDAAYRSKINSILKKTKVKQS